METPDFNKLYHLKLDVGVCATLFHCECFFICSLQSFLDSPEPKHLSEAEELDQLISQCLDDFLHRELGKSPTHDQGLKEPWLRSCASNWDLALGRRKKTLGTKGSLELSE
jgi:hypothetical protein